MTLRLGILGSTRGSLLRPIMNAIQQGKLAVEVAVVISNKVDAGILQAAKEWGLEAIFCDPCNLSRSAYDDKVSHYLRQAGVDCVVLIGYMRILSASFVSAWKNKVINVHPSLLPAFAGLVDLAVHESVIAAGVKETGCTVHYVTEEVDAGPIIVQKRCPVLSDDSPAVLKARVQALEAQAMVEAIQKISRVD